MDPVSTMLLIVAVIVVAVLIFTPGGRKLIKRLVGKADVTADNMADQVMTAEELARKNEMETVQKTRRQLEDMETAFGLAKSQLQSRDQLVQEIALQKRNAADALREVVRLKSDNVPDETQREIGVLSSAGESAMAEVERMERELANNQPLYDSAQATMDRAAQLMASLPIMARQDIQQGNLDAAAIKIAAADKQIDHSLSAFSDKPTAGDELREMRQKMEAQAAAAHARMLASPKSAATTRMLIDSARGARTSRFDAALEQLMQPPAQPANDKPSYPEFESSGNPESGG